MLYKKIYKSLLGDILIVFDEEALFGLYLYSQKEFAEKLKDTEIVLINDEVLSSSKEDHKILKLTETWLDKYFSGGDPGFVPPIKVTGSEFRKDV